MKSIELLSIFRDGNIVIPLFFLKHYKKLNLEMEEFVFLMYLYHLGNCPFNPSRFGDDLGIETKVVMNYIGILTDKGMIRVEVLKNEKGLMEEFILLDDFFEKLSLLTMEEVNQVDEKSYSNVYELIEKEFGRTLSPMEYEIIKAWLDSRISEDLIKEAVREATFNGVSNLRYIDKILYEWGKSGVETVEDVDNMRKKRNQKLKKENTDDEDIDTEIFDWDWFDDE